MNILSFDQAANISGWSYWEDNKPKQWGIIAPSPKSLKGGARLNSLRGKFKEKIKTCDPDIVLIENPVGDDDGPENNWKTMQVLCQVQGVLLEVIAANNKEVEIVSPSSWQYTCGIHKRDRVSRKIGAQQFIKSTYNIADVPQDVVDSMCIAHHYIESKQEQRSVF